MTPAPEPQSNTASGPLRQLRKGRERHWLAAPLIVGAVSLAMTLVVVYSTARLATTQERSWLTTLVASGTDSIEEGIQSDVAASLVAAQLFASSGEMDGEGFRRFVLHVGTYRRPGLDGVGWCQKADQNELTELKRRIKRFGIEELTLSPGTKRSEYCPVLFKSGAHEQSYIGRDMFSSEEFFAAANRAGMSGSVASLAANERNLTVVIPVYHSGENLDTRDVREKAIKGFAFIEYSPEGITRRAPEAVLEQTDLRLRLVAPGELNTNQDSNFAPIIQQRGAGVLSTPEFTVYTQARIGEAGWIAEFKTKQAFDDASDRAVVHIVLIAGFAVSLLLSFVTGAEARARVSAVDTGLKLAKSEKQLLGANAAKDRFLAVVSHELRNPLGAIASSLQVMRMTGVGKDGPPVVKRALAAAERQVKLQGRLVDDLLDASRLASGKVSMDKRVLDLNEVARRSATQVRSAFRDKHQKLRLRLGDAPLLVDGDPLRLEQVFSNLLTNANKYTPEGANVELLVEGTPDHVIVRVSDEGIGISEKQLERIFDPFFQNRQGTLPSEGMGLGLSIVKALVSLHDGQVSASSSGIGQGSQFVVRLPRATGPQAEEHSSPESISLDAERASWKNGKTALVVDDMDDGREMLREFLQLLGYTVLEAASGESALQIARDCSPDVALLDIGLPDMDGVELAARLSKLEGFESTKLIAVTGYGADKDRERALTANFHEYMVKPVDLQRLVELLEGNS